jgi:hypothetical protein
LRAIRHKLILLILTTACSLSPEGRRLPPKETEEPTNQELVGWQKLSFKILLQKPEPTGTQIVGYDEVFKIFQRPEYGPCTDCHNNTWPTLPKDPAQAWTKLVASVKPDRNVATVLELSDLILGCVDMTREDHCAGDPTTPDDNIDEKMPTKEDYEAVTQEDLKLIQAWVTGGAPEKTTGAENVKPPVIESVHLFDLPQKVEFDTTSLSVAQTDWEVSASVQVKTASAECTATKVQLVLGDGKTVRTTTVPLECEGPRFRDKYVVSTTEPFPP